MQAAGGTPALPARESPMPIDLTISQALLLSDSSGVRVVAKSDDFPFAWEEEAVRLVEAFGPRPDGVAVPAALAFLSFGKKHTTVVQYADQPGGFGFRLMVLNRKLSDAIADPFAVADRFPPDWSARGSLPPLSWPPDSMPERAVEEIAALMAPDQPFYLGAIQSLLDGVRIAVPRPAPDDTVPRALWQLLPYRERSHLAFATFAFRPDERLNLAVLPTLPDPLPFGWVSEAKCGDHPPGVYEVALQLATEGRNQRQMDRLLHRRSSKDTLRLALILIGVAVLTVALMATKRFW